AGPRAGHAAGGRAHGLGRLAGPPRRHAPVPAAAAVLDRDRAAHPPGGARRARPRARRPARGRAARAAGRLHQGPRAAPARPARLLELPVSRELRLPPGRARLSDVGIADGRREAALGAAAREAVLALPQHAVVAELVLALAGHAERRGPGAQHPALQHAARAGLAARLADEGVA